MAQRFVSVGDDLTLPPSVKAADANLPARLSASALADTYAYAAGVDVRKHGAVIGSTADAAPALNAAANAARTAKLPLIIPKGTLYIDSTVDFRYLDVQSDADIIVRHTNAVGVIVGDTSTQRNARLIRMTSVKHAGTTISMWDWPFAAVQVMGLKGATVRIGNCSLLELYANASTTTDDSIAYNTFELQRINHLRLRGVNGAGWINENLFLGGSYNRITIMGTYQHNHNKWIKPSVEGSTSLIDIQIGSQNLFEDARAEGGTQVKFGTVTWKNYVIGMFLSNPNLIAPPFVLLEDLGVDNEITSRDLLQLSAHTVFKLDQTTPLFDTASTILDATKSLPTPSVGVGRLAMGLQNQRFIDTGLIKIEETRNTSLDNNAAPPSRINRFVLHCDALVMRPYVAAYDANGTLIDANVTPWAALYASLAPNAAGELGYSTPVSSMQLYVTNPAVKYLRFYVMTSLTTNPLFTHITLTAYAQSSKQPGVIESMRNAIHKPLFGATKPTKGVGRPGTVVHGPTASWKVTARADTTLTAGSDTTTQTVTSGTGIAAGDVIGILLPTGYTHWTTVAAITGTAVTLTTAPPVATAAGAAVSTTRWADL